MDVETFRPCHAMRKFKPRMEAKLREWDFGAFLKGQGVRMIGKKMGGKKIRNDESGVPFCCSIIPIEL